MVWDHCLPVGCEPVLFVTHTQSWNDLAAPMLDSLSAGLRECMRKELVGEYLRLDSFFDNMLRSRISRRVIAEQHLQMNNPRWVNPVVRFSYAHDLC